MKKKRQTNDYVAPECEVYPIIPEKGVFQSNSFETEEPDIEVWY